MAEGAFAEWPEAFIFEEEIKEIKIKKVKISWANFFGQDFFFLATTNLSRCYSNVAPRHQSSYGSCYCCCCCCYCCSCCCCCCCCPKKRSRIKIHWPKVGCQAKEKNRFLRRRIKKCVIVECVKNDAATSARVTFELVDKVQLYNDLMMGTEPRTFNVRSDHSTN